jgi:hypothetical protein
VRSLLDGGGGIRTLASAFLKEAELERVGSGRPSIPALLNYRSTDRVEVNVRLPRGVRFMHLPEASDVNSPNGWYTRTVTAQGAQLTFTRTLVIDAVLVPAAEIHALRAFSDAVFTADTEPVVLQLPRGR